ncbi:hypothetical protein F1559_001887 [Cyanidiococcus yangmingshanensis]|uniref:Uncharacterized protein n=1 Tax=Cyanidiococcus yangmingshanensis TaxID=2690220 RepID=A0A7J7ILC1_9RHOD|nr:hypothetical protein F1559_001887 [Cyanidiococcus yangmingshanensis]
MRVTDEQQLLKSEPELTEVAARTTKTGSLFAQFDSDIAAESLRNKKRRARNDRGRPASVAENTGPLSEIKTLERGKKELEEKLARIERQIYDMETSYLEDTWAQGNIARGWDNTLRKGSRHLDGTTAGSRGSSAQMSRPRKMQDIDRIFSRSFYYFSSQGYFDSTQCDFVWRCCRDKFPASSGGRRWSAEETAF